MNPFLAHRLLLLIATIVVGAAMLPHLLADRPARAVMRLD
jgi:hypothetical protein